MIPMNILKAGVFLFGLTSLLFVISTNKAQSKANGKIEWFEIHKTIFD